METPTKVINDLVILAGGVEIEVHHTEGETPTETVKVRQLPLRRMADFGNLQANEGALIELFCNKPPNWADTLSLESAEEVVELGMRLNLDPFARWAERRLSADKQLRPVLDKAKASNASLSLTPPPL